MVAGGGPADPVAAAHARLLTDRSIQFAWSVQPQPRASPSWLLAALQAIGRLLKLVAPFIRIGSWTLLLLALAIAAVMLVRHLLVPSAREKRRPPLSLQQTGLAAEAASRAVARLAEADRLAAEAQYGAAAHLLLLRGIADVQDSRPGRIRPSLTSRDIAALPDLPPEPRAAFALIAAVVERALFGARPVDREAWTACRTAYEALVRPEAWSAPSRAPA